MEPTFGHFAKKFKDQGIFQCKSGYWKNMDFLFFVTKCKKYDSFSCTLVISNNINLVRKKYDSFSCTLVISNTINLDDIFLYFSVAKASLESQMSVCHRKFSAPQKHAYQPNLSQVAIMPISNDATQPPCPPPLSLSELWLSAIMHISHHAHTAL